MRPVYQVTPAPTTVHPRPTRCRMSSTSRCTQIDRLPTVCRAGADSSTVLGTPCRASSRAPESPTGPAPTISTGSTAHPSAVLGVLEVEPAAGIPFGALVSVRRNAARVLQHARKVQQVPGHERGVAVGEVVVRPAGSRIQIGRSGSGLADPPGVGLRWNRVSQVLQAVQHVHGAVLDAVLVAGDQAAAHPAVVRVLAGIVEQM